MSENGNTTCSLCGSPNFRRCACPWSQPFENWARGFMDKLKTIINRDPTPWS